MQTFGLFLNNDNLYRHPIVIKETFTSYVNKSTHVAANDSEQKFSSPLNENSSVQALTKQFWACEKNRAFFCTLSATADAIMSSERCLKSLPGQLDKRIKMFF